MPIEFYPSGQQKNQSLFDVMQVKITYLPYTYVFLLIMTTGCSVLPFQKSVPPDPPIRLLVAQIKMVAPLTSPTDLKTFDKKLTPEEEPALLTQLIEDVEVSAQRLFIDQLVQQEGFTVIPFAEAQQIQTDLGYTNNRLNKVQRVAFGAQTGADIVLSGRILDYGKVQWRYWVTGLILSMTAETLIVGAATGFNPGIMAIAAASELVTDLPLWWGGAYIAGWAFRPVRIEVKATQIAGCEQQIWKEQELVVLVPGKTLKNYLPEDKKRKEIQLGANLERVLKKIAKTAGQELRIKPCKQDKET
ncbi:MAG: hypothetical protein KGN35_00435 [Betaproteobacteria bacterium]|nr:hypothetical protein [Betaproteobacteria bacterium]